MGHQREWFGPKSHGYGGGLPIAWQGWALLLGYLAVVIGGAFLFAGTRPILYFLAVIALTVGFVWITSKSTRGGWRWLWVSATELSRATARAARSRGAIRPDPPASPVPPVR
jgi:hypothetical protein